MGVDWEHSVRQCQAVPKVLGLGINKKFFLGSKTLRGQLSPYKWGLSVGTRCFANHRGTRDKKVDLAPLGAGGRNTKL